MSHNSDPEKWETVSSEYLFRRPWLTARRDTVKLPDGAINPEFYVLEYPTWVNVIAITKDGQFVMERQYRHGLGEVGTEICAGVVEEGEEPLEAARRELYEETGYIGGEWTELCVISGNPSVTNNLTHCYLAVGVEQSGSLHMDATEDIAVRLFSKEEVWQMLLDDEIKQALMAAPLWKYFSLKERNLL